MARHKDVSWDLPDGTPKVGGGSAHQWQSIHAALLMDIRDELKRLNAAIWCPNFLGMPSELRRIATNTTKRKRASAGRRT